MTAIQAHNERPAAVWSSGGAAYDEVSHQISSALEHCVSRLDPKPGERILDLATGTGWTSRLLARRGAQITGVDIASDLVAAAKESARVNGLSIDYELGDAEQLRFSDGSFDALTTWRPDSNVFEMFKVMRAYMPPPPSPAPPSPFAWGTPERLQELFGANFDLQFEQDETIYYDRDGETAWQKFVTGYGPTKALAGNLDDGHREKLKKDFAAFHDRFSGPLGIRVPRQYLLTIGTRR